jgi:hypothetical protein
MTTTLCTDVNLQGGQVLLKQRWRRLQLLPMHTGERSALEHA